jgi:hypothetical protein
LTDIRDLRGSDRFIAIDPLAGFFGPTSVVILDLAHQGAQVEHAQPLRLGTRARLVFKRADISVAVNGIAIWSHLSKTPNERGKYLYRTGIRIESPESELASAVQRLSGGGYLRRDEHSLQRKRERAEEKHLERLRQPQVKVIRPDHDIPTDTVLLIEHARTRLRGDPEEARKWYNRARFALTEEHSRAGAESIRHREDVLAVWEYLERSIDLATIVRVFERHAK